MTSGAVPRKELGKQRPIESMEEARDWERLFIGEIKAGRDPRIKPARKEASANLQTVAGFLDAYFDRHLRPAGIRSLDTAAGRIKILKRHMGELAVKALEEPALINRFKNESEYSRRVEISTYTRCWQSCVPPSAGARRRLRHSSTNRRSTASAFG
jgi:hypothetical protein